MLTQGPKDKKIGAYEVHTYSNPTLVRGNNQTSDDALFNLT